VDNDSPAENGSTKAAVPLIVGLDGAYVHAQDQPSRTEGWFEVIVGKSLATEDQASKCFAFVSRYDPEPECRLLELLKAQGLQSNQPVTFLSDGGDTVRELPRGLISQAEYVLDWFHVTMRLTGMSRMAQGVREADPPTAPGPVEPQPGRHPLGDHGRGIRPELSPLGKAMGGRHPRPVPRRRRRVLSQAMGRIHAQVQGPRIGWTHLGRDAMSGDTNFHRNITLTLTEGCPGSSSYEGCVVTCVEFPLVSAYGAT
jgi:hypothetical protein